MSKRPTPETDALILSKDGFGATNYEWREHSRKLERERDEAMAKYAAEATEHMLAVNKLAGERDKERKELEEVRAERDILRLDAQREAEHHDRMVGELEKTYRERDEARKHLAAANKGAEINAHINNSLTAKLAEAKRERDEAREALDCLLAVIGLTPIAGNKHALQDAVDHGLAVLRKQQEAAK